jgi:hypothetical protein
VVGLELDLDRSVLKFQHGAFYTPWPFPNGMNSGRALPLRGRRHGIPKREEKDGSAMIVARSEEPTSQIPRFVD